MWINSWVYPWVYRHFYKHVYSIQSVHHQSLHSKTTKIIILFYSTVIFKILNGFHFTLDIVKGKSNGFNRFFQNKNTSQTTFFYVYFSPVFISQRYIFKIRIKTKSNYSYHVLIFNWKWYLVLAKASYLKVFINF